MLGMMGWLAMHVGSDSSNACRWNWMYVGLLFDVTMLVNRRLLKSCTSCDLLVVVLKRVW
jgi:hypothetical protein